MDGLVKWFSEQKGFGFIHVPGKGDYFFHVSNVNGPNLPRNGDPVTFQPIEGKDGRPAASDVVIQKTSTKSKVERPSSGPHAFVTITSFKDKYTVRELFFLSLLLGLLGLLISLVIFDGILAHIFLTVGASGFAVLAKDSLEPVQHREEITGACLRCGGEGQVTAVVDNRVGFQCERCKHYWKKYIPVDGDRVSSIELVESIPTGADKLIEQESNWFDRVE